MGHGLEFFNPKILNTERNLEKILFLEIFEILNKCINSFLSEIHFFFIFLFLLLNLQESL